MSAAKQAAELRYAVRFRVVFKYFGQLCLALAALTLVPLVASVIFGDTLISLRYGMVIAGLAALGAGLARLRAPSWVQANEGMVLVALMFLFTPLVMSYPMMGSELGFPDALFEAISGVTTTGLSTKATLVDAPQTFLFARAWMQWYGGLGIVVLSLALIMQPGMVAKNLAVTEAETDDLVGGTRAHARQALIVYGILTVLGIIGSFSLGIGLFDAVLYTFAAVSTGGFAPHDNSLATFGWPVQVWITLLCLAGAIPLTFYYRMFKEKRRVAVDFLQLRAVVIASLIVSLAVSAAMRLSAAMAWPQVLHHAPLLAFSAQTTAGFSSTPCGQLDAGSKLMLIFSMLVGGGAGSTAGGFKLLRLLFAASVFRLILLRTCLPNRAVIKPRLAGRRLQEEEIHAALLLIVLFVAVVALSWLPFVAMGYSPLDSLFEVVSATGTAGLSVGLTGATLPPLLKGILCVDMLMGRLEIMAWLVMLYPGTWFGRRMEGA
ncbi:MAG: TrkH family potassium uptake protein [Deltaproteobacteria bacterium]|nr:TrkH family potassium uptake protein [Deltaproteobacteria bacterium]